MSYSAQILADSPLGYWRFAEMSGTVANDSSGNARHGTYVGTPTLGIAAPGGVGDTAIVLNGTSQNVDCGNLAAFQLTTISYEVWFKRDAPQGSYYRAVMVKEGAFGILYEDNQLGYYSWASPTFFGSGISPSDGVWHHAVLTSTSGVANGTKLYLDGVLTITNAVTIRDQLVALKIGENGANSQLFNGSVDEAVIYGTILSQDRISAHYAAGRDIIPQYQPFVSMAVRS